VPDEHRQAAPADKGSNDRWDRGSQTRPVPKHAAKSIFAALRCLPPRSSALQVPDRGPAMPAMKRAAAVRANRIVVAKFALGARTRRPVHAPSRNDPKVRDDRADTPAEDWNLLGFGAGFVAEGQPPECLRSPGARRRRCRSGSARSRPRPSRQPVPGDEGDFGSRRAGSAGPAIRLSRSPRDRTGTRRQDHVSLCAR
jgi:hypothetical protein